MFDNPSAFLTPGLEAWCVLSVVWLIERNLSIASSVDPIAFFRFVCERMAKQVLPASQQSQQHYISGSLALIVLLSPLLLIVYLISEFASYQWLLDGFILYLALQFGREANTCQQVKKALLSNKKQLAKDILAQSVLRDTAPLSSMGVAKACIEMYALRYVYQQAVVMFWFIVIGPVAALGYRSCFEAHQSWNTKLPKFQRFGWLAYKVCMLAQWLPTRIFGFIVSFLSLPHTGLKHVIWFFKPLYFLRSNAACILFSSKAMIGRTLSGAVMYEGQKIRRTKYLALSEPSAGHIDTIRSAFLLATMVYLCILLIISWGMYA